MLREVDEERRIGRVRADEEAAIRFTLGCREQSDIGSEGAVLRRLRNFTRVLTGGKPTYFWCLISL